MRTGFARTRCAPRPDGRGFTLLEVMVSLAILAVSLVAIAGINSAAIGMHAYAKRLTLATMLARSKMADMESKLMSDDLPADDSAEEGTFEEEGFPEYHWRAEIIRPKTENITPADLLSSAGLDTDPSKQGSGSGPLAGIASSLTGATGSSTSSPTGTAALASAATTGGAGLLGAAMNSQVQTLLDLLGKTVREIRLTVFWQAGKQLDQFTVVTHVVSFGRGTDQATSDPTQSAANGTNGTSATNAAGNAITGLPGMPGTSIPGMPGMMRPGLPGAGQLNGAARPGGLMGLQRLGGGR